MPLITAETIKGLVDAHEANEAAATMATMEPDDPAQYGRVIRDKHGNVERVVEVKAEGDATPEQPEIREVNTGVYAFDGGSLLAALAQIDTDNAQGELYLPDVLPKLREAARRSRPTSSRTRASRWGSTTASTWPRSASSPSSRSTTATPATASRSSTRPAR